MPTTSDEPASIKALSSFSVGVAVSDMIILN
jgi:hypothetical protein